MPPARMSGALLEKLGEPASAQLAQILDDQQRASTEAVMTQCADRFERRLTEDTSKLHVEVAQLRGEMREGFAQVRGEMREGFAQVRGELRESVTQIRDEMRESVTGLRQEIATNRFELLRWAFAFWVGQVMATAAIVGLLLRTLPGR